MFYKVLFLLKVYKGYGLFLVWFIILWPFVQKMIRTICLTTVMKHNLSITFIYF